MALGLGEMQLESYLNEPLRASVDLLNMEGLHEDEVRVRLATSEDFEKLGLDRAYFLTNITFEVVSDGRGGAKILLRSEEPVLEPYLDFIVEARWPSGRLLRNYTVLIDPPVFSQATPVVSASERVATTEGIPAPAPAKKSESYSYDYNAGRVNVQQRSDLAAGAMPQRNYNASTAGTPTPGSRYMIHRDQTLWEIASMAKPAGVSVHQTMLDIQRMNPDAFINGNINRIKAGFIIYLPTAEDISSADLPTALAEVREQNAAWREGRDTAPYASSGPSLRISAEPEDAAPTETAGGSESPGAAGSASPAPDTGVASRTGGASAETLERLAALEQQLETLQRIVALKDDQIAALQSALKEAGGSVDAVESGLVTPDIETEIDVDSVSVDMPVAADDEDVGVDIAAEEPAPAPVAETEAAAETAKPAPAKPAETAPTADKKPPAPAESADGWTSYLLYILGALVLLIAGFVFARRRGEQEQEEEALPVAPVAATAAATTDDVFADVQLQDQNVEVQPETSSGDDKADVLPEADNRGYGEHKHDAYASDVDAADALAEADIYIAYGRHPQAIDLLNNALVSEPGNPVYRLKLLEIYVELDNQGAAMAQYKKIMDIGDSDSIARAELMIERLGDDAIVDEGLSGSAEPAQPDPRPTQDGAPGLAPNPLDILTDSNESLEEVFTGLEIEEEVGDDEEEDDLDLSGDFEVDQPESEEDEELVIAADSNALSTKLDLARAYLDMGDDDGARQILDEVVAEGSAELQAEARALLERIG